MADSEEKKKKDKKEKKEKDKREKKEKKQQETRGRSASAAAASSTNPVKALVIDAKETFRTLVRTTSAREKPFLGVPMAAAATAASPSPLPSPLAVSVRPRAPTAPPPALVLAVPPPMRPASERKEAPPPAPAPPLLPPKSPTPPAPTPPSPKTPPAPPSPSSSAIALTDSKKQKRFTMRQLGVSPPIQQHRDYTLKMCLIGPSGVGKTSLWMRFNNRTPTKEEMKATLGVEFYSMYYQTEQDQKTIQTNIWDTAGQETYKAVVRAYFRGSNAFLAVYDVCSIRSWNELTADGGHIGRAQDEARDAIVMVIGNKIDRPEKDRQVPLATAEGYCQENNFLYMETSALDNTHVQEALESLLEWMYKARLRANPKPDPPKNSVSVVPQGETVVLERHPSAIAADDDIASQCLC
jgi:Ras-related protein Rab-11A